MAHRVLNDSETFASGVEGKGGGIAVEAMAFRVLLREEPEAAKAAFADLRVPGVGARRLFGLCGAWYTDRAAFEEGCQEMAKWPDVETVRFRSGCETFEKVPVATLVRSRVAGVSDIEGGGLPRSLGGGKPPERAPPPPAIESPAKEPAKLETPPLYFVGKTTECRLFRKRCVELGKTIKMHGDGGLEKWLPKQPGFVVVVSCENGKTDLPPGYSYLVSDEDLASPRLKESSGVIKKQVNPTSVVYIVFGHSREALWKEIENFSFD